jgi:hypothetical protein
MKITEHREFALSIGIPADIYDSMNARHSAHNAKIRATRAEWYAAFGTAQRLDEALQADW